MIDDPLIGMTFHFTPPVPQQDNAPRGGLGSQVLPVAELDDDFEGDPEDGMEYLFLVRREAASHARVYRAAHNPYAVTEEEAAQPTKEYIPSSRPSEAWKEAFVKNFRATRQRMAVPPPTSSFPPTDPVSIPGPRDESSWRVFINGKRSKAAKVAPAPPPKPPAATTPQLKLAPALPFPEDSEMTDLAAAKAAILASLEIDAPEPSSPPRPPPKPAPQPAAVDAAPAQIPEFERLPQLPSPALVLSIPKPSLIHVLSHFNDWFTERAEAYDDAINYVPSTIFAPPSLRRKVPSGPPASSSPKAATPAPPKGPPPRAPLPAAHEVHWILSLLTRLEGLLDGDDLSNLRLLAKTLAEMAEVSETERVKRDVPGRSRSMDVRRQDEDEAEGRARCWMVVAAIAGGWDQPDLWNSNL
ncbi:hypothetical protein JCM21900_003927 [Sporobolomyces salmonicolor]